MSYITVDADRVISAVDDALKWIQLQKDHRQANMIRRYATKRRWFGFAKPWGYQRAFEFLETGYNQSWPDDYEAIQLYTYGGDISDLKALRRLAVEASESNKLVNVSADMSHIFS
jgi:hypothetical protein